MLNIQSISDKIKVTSRLMAPAVAHSRHIAGSADHFEISSKRIRNCKGSPLKQDGRVQSFP